MTIETTHILLKRGNTSQSLTYTGPLGEVTIDTDLRSLRVHDGVTPGGNLVSSGTGISSTNQLVNGNKTVSLASTGLTTFPTFQTGNASLSIQGANVGSTNAGLSILAKNEVLISADLLGTVKNWIFGTDGTLILPNAATISGVDVGFSYTAPSNGPGGVAVQLNSLTVGIPNPTWAAAILANPGDYHLDFNGGPSDVAIAGITGPASGTNVYTLTGTWAANATGFPITIASDVYEANGITKITSADGVQVSTTGGDWAFGVDGATTFPTLTVPLEDNANPIGTGQVLKFSDSTQQAIIFGPVSTAGATNAERVIIQGAPGYTGTAGEGGDVYVWAGPGGSTDGNGGDIKVRAGRGNGTGTGGYLNFQAGDTATGAGGHINIESGESGTYGSGGDITVQARSGGEITLRTHTSGGTNTWLFGADGALTLPSGYPILFGNGNSRIQAGMGFHINSEEGISLEAVDATDPLLPDVHQWHFGTDGALNSPGGSFTKTTNNYLANNVTTQVVWTSTQNGISGVKLTIQVECDETGGVNYPNWETQVCEAIIAVRGYNSVSEPVMSVYGVTHTSVEPLMTFSVQRNPTTYLIEMVGTRAATASPLGGADLRIYSVETGTND